METQDLLTISPVTNKMSEKVAKNKVVPKPMQLHSKVNISLLWPHIYFTWLLVSCRYDVSVSSVLRALIRGSGYGVKVLCVWFLRIWWQ